MTFKLRRYANALTGWVLLVSVSFGSPVLAEQLMFKHDDISLAGHYLLPSGHDQSEVSVDPKGIVIFVHGDGAMNYDAYGYYEPLWNVLRQQGYAIFSWDKPGVGDSGGDWLTQSMADRQQEVRAAIAFLQQRYGYQGPQIGLLGFSQAGWVVPAVAADNPNVGFVIGVGFAIDWIEQGAYLTKIRLRLENRLEHEITQSTHHYRKEVQRFSVYANYAEYVSDVERMGDDVQVLSKPRFYFVQKNYLANAYNDYLGVEQPLLMLLGADDLNVDVQDTRRQLQKNFSERDNLSVVVFPKATHGLLKSSHFSEQSPGIWSWIKLMWLGEEAFADNVLATLKRWIIKI